MVAGLWKWRIGWIFKNRRKCIAIGLEINPELLGFQGGQTNELVNGESWNYLNMEKYGSS